jgi:colanic acid biosynthesis glycosyl transferase WcaI
VTGAADVSLVNERPGSHTSRYPAKLTSYFNSSKPMLAATGAARFRAGELAAQVLVVCVPPHRPNLLMSEAIRLGMDRELARRLASPPCRW